jgi:hypothetical protein
VGIVDLFGNRKALSSLWIIVIVLLGVVGASVYYFWFWPGDLRIEEMDFRDFTAVDVSQAFEVSITQSSSYSVTITADQKIFDDIEVTQTGNTLVIGFEPGSVPGGLRRTAKITMPDLTQVMLSGATQGTAEGFSTSEAFVLLLSGASSLELIDITVGDAEIAVSGASTLNAGGTANDLVSLVSGASNVDFSNFPVNNADIAVSGASHATINVAGRLDADVSGASTLEYIGEPTMGDINTSGDSTLKKK